VITRALAAIAVVILVAACPRREPPPVTPAPPLPADPEVQLDAMEKECDGMVAALTAYKACPNHEERDANRVQAWIEAANRNFAASRKANPEPNAKKAIAAACRKATDSVKAALQRCEAGKRPRVD
jgi:hypothetical protein